MFKTPNQDFEEWAAARGFDLLTRRTAFGKRTLVYVDDETHCAWCAWEASREFYNPDKYRMPWHD